MSTPACTVSAALLVPQDRVARLPVPRWAAELRGRLDAARRGERRAWHFAAEVGTASNQAALIASFQGATDTAEELCRGQMVWQDRAARRSGNAEIALLSVQPWVNLGRLEAMAGEWPAALERFARLVHPGADGRLCLGSARIGVPRGEAGPRRDGFGGFLRDVYVADTLKALLANRRWEEVLAFAGRVAGDAASEARADEARVVAHCRLGDAERGAAVAAARRTASAGWTRAVFALRRGEALGIAGRAEEAAGELSRLAATLRQLTPGTVARLENLYVVVRAAQACAEQGLEDDARALARAAAGAAEAAGEEVLRIEALRVLGAAAGDEDGEAAEALERLEGETGYARYRRGGTPPLREETADALFAELRALFAA